jgi:hypothetical protein
MVTIRIVVNGIRIEYDYARTECEDTAWPTNGRT